MTHRSVRVTSLLLAKTNVFFLEDNNGKKTSRPHHMDGLLLQTEAQLPCISLKSCFFAVPRLH